MRNKRMGMTIGALMAGLTFHVGAYVSFAETPTEPTEHIPSVTTKIKDTQSNGVIYTYSLEKQSVVATDSVTMKQVSSLSDQSAATEWAANNSGTDKKTTTPKIAKNKKTAAVTPNEKLPITVVADSMFYSDATGDVNGKGRVDVTQGNMLVKTESVEGNLKTSTYHAPGLVYYKEGPIELNGVALTYNSLTQNMLLDNAEGYAPPYYIRGNDIDYTDGEGHIKRGMLTTVHAMAWQNPPDYRVEGQDIVVKPNDEMIIKEAKFFIRNWHFLTLKSYTASLKHDKGFNAFSFIPVPSYSSSNGFGLKASVVYPTSERGELFYSYAWYSKVGYKPDYGYNYYTNWGNMSFAYRKEESTLNDTNVWIKKTPEFAVSTKTYHIANTPFTANARATVGRWEQGEVRGTHRLIQGELSHDPLLVTKDLSIRGFVGYQRDFYSYNDSIRSMPYWGIQNNYRVNNRFNVWAYYRQQNRGDQSPYTFDTDELKKRMDIGGYYQLTPLDAVSLNVTWDLENHGIKYKDLTYYRDLHSMAVTIQYRLEQKEWKLGLIIKDF